MTIWNPCGCLAGSRCNHAALSAERNRMLRKLDRLAAQENRQIERGNMRRRAACEKALEWAMRGELVRARVWVSKLVSAGFSRKDGATIEKMDCAGIEREMRSLLGLEQPR